MVKRLLSVILFLATLYATTYSQTKHYFITWAELGESSLLTTLPSSSGWSVGVGGAIGAGYELKENHFLLNFGLSANIARSTFLFTDLTQTITNAIDDEGDTFDYIYHQTKRRDSYTNLSLKIPLLMGGAWHKFYFLAGAKLNVSMLVATRVRTTITASGDYPQFIDPFTDMPEHSFFSDGYLNQTGRTKFRLDPMLSLEFGYRFGNATEGHSGWDVPKNKYNYRLAAFFDYGLLNINNKGDKPFVTFPEQFDYTRSMKEGITINDVLSTVNAQSPVHNLLIGIKFTATIEIPQKGKCLFCYD